MRLIKKDSYEPEGLSGYAVDFVVFFLSVLACVVPASIIVVIVELVTSGGLVSTTDPSGSYAAGFITAMFALQLNNWINGKIYKMQQEEKGE